MDALLDAWEEASDWAPARPEPEPSAGGVALVNYLRTALPRLAPLPMVGRTAFDRRSAIARPFRQ